MSASNYKIENHPQSHSQSNKFAQYRSWILFAMGLLVSVGGVAFAFQTRIAHGAWTVNPWLFVFVVAVGLVIAAISRIAK